MSAGVRFNEERNKQHETGQFILNSQIYAQCMSSPVDPQMRRNLNAQVPRAQGAFVRDGPRPSKNINVITYVITAALSF